MSNSRTNPINRVKTNASPKWQKAALAVVRKLAKKRAQLTSYDVLVELEKWQVKTRDLRAVGGVMIDARDQGYIQAAGLVRCNDRFSRGARVLWQSLLFQASRTGR